jgi:hypothetical protein
LSHVVFLLPLSMWHLKEAHGGAAVLGSILLCVKRRIHSYALRRFRLAMPYRSMLPSMPHSQLRLAVVPFVLYKYLVVRDHDMVLSVVEFRGPGC